MSPHRQAFGFIKNRFGDEVLHEVNRSAFDRIGAATLFEQQYGTLFSRPDTLFVVLGTDSGLLPRWIAGRERAPGSRFIFVELPQLIDTIRHQTGELMDEAGFALTTPALWRDLTDEFRFSDYAYLGNLKVVTSLGVRDANLSDYRLLEREVTAQAEDFNRSIQLQLGNHAFIQRQIENIADNLTPAVRLKDCAAGATAVLLAGGPSLDDILPWVERHRERITVIAVSRISRRLLHSTVRPDIVVSIDPHRVSFDVSKEALQFENRPLLVAGNHVSPLLLGQWPGPAVYRGEHFPWPTDSNGENLPMVGPTVTNMALAMAVDMGFTRVILGGVDLCYSAEGHTHASASNERATGPRLGIVGQQVETNSGRLADTDPPFAQAVQIMDGQAQRALQRGCEIVNPAPGAARMAHVRYIPLAELDIPGHHELDVPRIIRQAVADDPAGRRATLQQAAKELAWARHQLHGVLKLSRAALDSNQRLFGDGQGRPDFRFKKRMDKIERSLDRDFRKITPLLKSFAAAGFLSLLRPNRNDEWTDQELSTWGRRYYEIYIEAASLLEGMIDQAQQRVGARLEEIQAAPRLELLLQQWRKDDQPARAVHFSAAHPELLANASPTLQQGFRELADEYAQVLAETDTPHARSLRQHHSLAPVRSKLLILFQRHERDELSRLAKALDGLDRTEAAELAALARGYLAELDGLADAALAQYQAIVDTAVAQLHGEQEQQSNPRLEDALSRMAFLSLERQDRDTALQALQILSTLSPAYQPQYADMLRLAGQLQAAVDIYTDYLHKAPMDLATMMKLGKLFQEAGAADAARQAYAYILERSPDNQAARDLLSALNKTGVPA